MASLISPATWANYAAILRDFHDTAFQNNIIWRRTVLIINPNGEDPIEEITDTNLKGLIDYDYFRKWSTQNFSEAGSLDGSNIVLLLNRVYLQENGWINLNGNFAFDLEKDRFIQKGIIYKPTGFTDMSQAQADPLLCMVILSREETNTGQDVR